MAGPLAGARILDLAEEIAGPFGAKLLANLGADVIKIERPAGDIARRAGPFPDDIPNAGISGRFISANDGKRGITLDVGTESGRAILEKLLDTSAAVIQSLPAGALGRAGLTREDIQARWPWLAVCTVSPLGATGPDASRRETELTLAARSGWLAGFGSPEREPLAYPGPQISYLSGFQAALATLGAILLAEHTGTGQWIDVSMMESITAAFDQQLLGIAFTPHTVRRRTGRRTTRFPPSILPTANGFVSVLVTDNQWPRFCRMCGFTDLAEDASLRVHAERTRRMEELEARFIPWFLERTKEAVFLEAQKFSVPLTPFNSIAELMDDPHFTYRGVFVTTELPNGRTVKVPSRPYIFSETPWLAARGAPRLGEHNAEVYAELGLGIAEQQGLRAAGVI